MTDPGVVAAVALASAVVLCPVAMSLALRSGFVDAPGPLKPQAHPVPLLGGAAVFAAVVASCADGDPKVLGPLGGALALGVLDDRLSLPPWTRLVAQAAIGGAVAFLVPTRLPGAGGDVLVVIAAVILMNGVNFLDGLDALTSVVLAISCGTFAVLLHGTGRLLASALAASLVGFLLYNRPPARLYLGDGGSYFLGTGLAVLAAHAWASGIAAPKSIASLLLVALPLAEVAFGVVRRARARSSVTRGDRRHPYDLLVARGCSGSTAVLVYGGVQLVLALVAIVTSRSSAITAPIVSVALAAAFLATLGAISGALSPNEGLRA